LGQGAIAQKYLADFCYLSHIDLSQLSRGSNEKKAPTG